MNTDARQYLAKMPHFTLLPETELDRIAASAIAKSYSVGDRIASQGRSKIDSIFIVTRGVLTLYDERDGRKTLAGHIKSGEVFGGITILLNGGISLRSVEVEKSCSGFEVPENIFQDLCSRFKSFYEYFLENFSQNITDPSLSAIIETGQARRFLESIEPFSLLPEAELERVAAELAIVRYPKDTILLVQGRSRVGYLYILQSGSVERYFEQDQKKSMRELLEEGDAYGGISMLLNDGISVRTVKVLEKSLFYLMPRQQFLDLCDRYDAFSESFTDRFGKRMMEKSYAAIIAKTIGPKEEGLHFFNQHVASIYSNKPVFGTTDMTIRQAAQTMAQHKISSLFIRADEAGACVGVVTERDLTRRVTAKGYAIDHPVSDIMSTSVRTIPEYALIIEALMRMMENDIRHLAVTDVDDNVVGILSNRDLLAAQGQSPLFLIRHISGAQNMAGIIESHTRLPHIVRTLISNGVQASNLTRFITTVSDNILEKVIGFALDTLEPPPVGFAFMILGSEGRREQTLKTDQDNAIIYEDVPTKREPAVREWFLEFGQVICGLLNDAGYDYCRGDVMAQNPRWCQSLSTWKGYFTRWIRAASPEDLLQASIFFDFRCGYGQKGLIDQLRTHLFNSLEGWSGFFRHLTENALHFKPPLGFLRNFVVESKGVHRSKFDIKSAMTPIVDFARIYALHHRIEETNTMDRLAHLRLIEVLTPEAFEELEKAYGFLMQLRFVRQITAILDEKISADNYINPKKLTRIEQKMLKEIFIRVEKFQGRMDFDFIGLL